MNLNEEVYRIKEIMGLIVEVRENWTLEKLRELTLQYDDYTKFSEEKTNARNALRRKGLLDDYTSHMKKKKYYTEDEIEAEARKYESIVDFRKNSPNFYNLAKQRNLMPKFREFLVAKNIVWTDEMLKDEALKYSTKNEFNLNSGSAYRIAKERGIFDDITSHMDQLKIWTYDEAKEESLKYQSKTDFKNSPAFYQSVRNGWIDDFFDNSYEYWDKERAHQESLKYKTKNEFRSGSPKAYYAAHNRGWIDDITKHMTPVGSLYERMVYVYEFSDNHAYVGLTLNKDKRNKEHLDLEIPTSPVAKHIIKTGLEPVYKEVSAYITAVEAQNLEQCTMDKYKNEGWVLLNSVKGGGLGFCKRTELTMEIIRDLASKFPTRVAFKRAHKNEYQIAQKYGWLQDVLKDIPVQDRTKWTYDKTKEEASKYKNRSEFKSKNQSAYRSALKNNWLDEFFPTNIKECKINSFGS
jgi:hypothetical protein